MNLNKQIFTTPYLNSLLKVKKEPLSNLTEFEKVYNNFFNFHKYEYIFKNEFLNLYLNKITNNEYKLLYELEIYKDNILINILDLLLITDKSALAIEIKSDFDNCSRLQKQLETYSQLFQFVSIFISEEKLNIYEEFLRHAEFKNIGIIILQNKSIKTVKKPLPNNNLNKDLIIENILKINKSIVIDESITMDHLYRIWLNTLNNLCKIDINFIKKMPRPLKFYSYSHGFMKPLKKARFIKLFSR